MRKFKQAQIEHALRLLETHSYKQVEETTGITKSTLIRAKKAIKQKIRVDTDLDDCNCRFFI